MQDLTTIWVVDDETLIRTFAAEALETAGYNVLEAADADAAISKLERYEYVSIIFTDIRMPGSMNGLEFARVVQERWPKIKVLLTSGADNGPPIRQRPADFFQSPIPMQT
jgi:DNA-binding NtrC family response regulator